MNIAAGPFTIASLLLVGAGALKAWAPGDTANALRAAGLPRARVLVRIGGVVEVAIGAYAVLAGTRIAGALVAASYLVFAAFVTLALTRDLPISTCGCFGKVDTPPSLVHVGVDAVAAIAGLAVVIDPGVAIGDVIDRQPLAGAPFLLLVAVGLYSAYLALTLLPKNLAAVREARTG